MVQQPMTVILDGLTRVYTKCVACHGLMQVVEPGLRAHPCCKPQQSTMETLCSQLLSAALADDRAAERQLSAQIEELDNRPPNLHAAAVRYTHMGWPVFPLAPLSKIPAIPKPKGHGLLDATTDTERISRWWTRHPTHNIGLATGHAFDVIDVDVKKGKDGVNSFFDLLRRGSVYNHNGFVIGNTVIPDVHGLAITASGGMHFYIEPTGKPNAANTLPDHPGIDFRGLGGYVCAPPTTLGGRGNRYSWLVTPSPKIRKD